jgi:hypothetical protein
MPEICEQEGVGCARSRLRGDIQDELMLPQQMLDVFAKNLSPCSRLVELLIVQGWGR